MKKIILSMLMILSITTKIIATPLNFYYTIREFQPLDTRNIVKDANINSAEIMRGSGIQFNSGNNTYLTFKAIPKDYEAEVKNTVMVHNATTGEIISFHSAVPQEGHEFQVVMPKNTDIKITYNNLKGNTMIDSKAMILFNIQVQ